MHKTLKDFLAAQHADQVDQLAQRALAAWAKCQGEQGFIANAYHRGDGDAYTEMSRAHYEASIAFVLINKHKAYPFAGEVLPGMAVQDVQTASPEAAAAFCVESAEAVIEAYAERCRPVCRIIGDYDTGVRILHGDHALHAMRGLVVANAA